MSKVLTFSRTFPAYHTKAGQPTNFVFKIWNSIGCDNPMLLPYATEYFKFDGWNQNNHELLAQMQPKHHTIRAGNRFKVGDKFSPRVWSGKPYQSKQIIIAPDIEVKKVWDFKIQFDADYLCISIDNWPFYEENSTMVTQPEALETLALNDGLTVEDMKAWFGIHPKKKGKNFNGQIICWNENIEY